jgi:hypothetical protein
MSRRAPGRDWLVAEDEPRKPSAPQDIQAHSSQHGSHGVDRDAETRETAVAHVGLRRQLTRD